MGSLLLFLSLALFGLGFITIKIFWWVALALAVVWLVGMIRPTEGGRSYRWGHR
jgi:hypothetical protein